MRDESTHRLHKCDITPLSNEPSSRKNSKQLKDTLNEMKDTTENVLGNVLELTPMSSQQKDISSCESDISQSFMSSRRNTDQVNSN